MPAHADHSPPQSAAEVAQAQVCTAGERIRWHMTQAARARAYQQAHRLLEQLWAGDEHALIEPPLLLWAAQRRTTGARLWWGPQERQRCVAMLSKSYQMRQDGDCQLRSCLVTSDRQVNRSEHQFFCRNAAFQVPTHKGLLDRAAHGES